MTLLIESFKTDIFKKRILETGFNKAFKGNWGARPNTKRIGVVQDLSRLSFNGYLCHLRKTNLPTDAGVKLVGPRVLRGSHWGFVDPIDTPMVANIGLHKSLAIAAQITRETKGTRDLVVTWLREKSSTKFLEERDHPRIGDHDQSVRQRIPGGRCRRTTQCVDKIKFYRRNSLIPIHMGVTFEIKTDTIYIYTDGGRLIRPIFYKDGITKKLSFDNADTMKALRSGDFTRNELISGFNKKRKGVYDKSKLYELPDLYEGISSETNPAKLERFIRDKSITDYIDSSESENALIAINKEEYPKNRYTRMEIHESLVFGSGRVI